MMGEDSALWTNWYFDKKDNVLEVHVAAGVVWGEGRVGKLSFPEIIYNRW